MIQPHNLVGTIIDEKFKIISLLGSGGMGAVYLAEQLGLSRKVAVKLMHLHMLESEESRLRFEREAKILSQLDNKHLIKVYAVGFYAEKIPYIVTEYLEGSTLALEIDRLKGLDWQRVLRLGVQICDGLSHVHQKGAIHRDLKPQNIMLVGSAEQECAKILDFGLAKALTESAANTITESGALLGSPHYLSPEQCSGLTADARSDIYSLACVLYECLVAKTPFRADNAIGLLYKHKTEIPESISAQLNQKSLPDGLDKVIMKALQKDPSARFQTADEFSQALTSLLNGTTIKLELESDNKTSSKMQSKILAVLFFTILCTLGLVTALNTSKKVSKQSVKQQQTMWLDESDKIIERVSQAKPKNLKSVEPSVTRALQLLTRALTYPRNQSLTQARELASIERFTTLSNAIAEPDFADYLLILKPVSNAAGLEHERKHFHNSGELNLLSGALMSTGSRIYCVAYLCLAAKSFSEAGEKKLCDHALDLAQFMAPEKPRNPIIDSRIELTKLELALSENKNFSFKEPSSQLAHQIMKLPSKMDFNKSELLIEIADLSYKQNDLDSAEAYLTEALKIIEPSQSPFRHALTMLAEIQEKKSLFEEAIETYGVLKEQGYQHTNMVLVSEAEAAIARIRPKSKQVTKR